MEDSNIEYLPRSIIRTGNEEGLSAPITFDPIAEDLRKGIVFGDKGEISAVETTLETAINFLMDLEQRAIAAFGLRPYPVESTRGLKSGFIDIPGLWI